MPFYCLLLFISISFGYHQHENQLVTKKNSFNNGNIFTNKQIYDCFEINDKNNYHFDESTNIFTVNETGLMCDCYRNISWNFDETKIETIIVKGSVSRVGNGCFRQFINATVLQLEEGIYEIGIGSFQGINITEVILPSSVIQIQEYSFQDCHQLETISFMNESKLQSIGNFAFKNCIHLKSFHIPQFVTSFERSIFEGCYNLRMLTVDNKNNHFQTLDNILLNKNGNHLIYFPPSIQHQHYIVLSSVEVFEENAFTYASMKSLSIENCVNEIKFKSFYGNKFIETIFIKENVTLIESYAFAFNDALEQLIITSQNLTIESEAFYGCKNLKSVIFIGEEIFIENNAFENCSNFNEIKVIENFDEENIHFESTEEIKLNKNSVIFEKCGDISMFLIDKHHNKNLFIFGDGEIQRFDSIIYEYIENIEYVFIENGITSIGEYGLSGFKSLKTLTLPKSITSIGNYAFQNCSNLERVIFEGNSITTIGKNLFIGCSSLKKIILENNSNYIIENGMLMNSKKTELIKYLETNINKEYIYLPDNLTTIHDEAISNNQHLVTLVIPMSVKSIGINAFSNCQSLKHVFYLGVVKPTSIGNTLFIGSNNVTTVNVKPTYTGDSTFDEFRITKQTSITGTCGDVNYFIHLESGLIVVYGNGNMGSYSWNTNKTPWVEKKLLIKYAIIEKGVILIGQYSFWEHFNLEEAFIPDTVKSIGIATFQYCHSLKYIFIPSSVSTFGKGPFSVCWSLEKIDVDKNNQHFISIDGIVFSKDMKTLYHYPGGKQDNEYTIPSSVTTLYSNSFMGTSKLKNVYIGTNVKTMGSETFIESKQLEMIYVDSNHELFKTIDGVLFDKKVTTMYGYPTGNKTGTYYIPHSVINIENSELRGCYFLETIIIPSGITSFTAWCFSYQQKLKTIIYEGTTSIPKASSVMFYNTDTSQISVIVRSDYPSTTFIGFTPSKMSSTTCGTSVYYHYHENLNYLYIYGSGSMNSFKNSKEPKSNSPWIDLRTNIKRIRIDHGITNIGYASFNYRDETNDIYGYPNVEFVDIGNTVTIIENGGLINLINVKTIYIPSSTKSITDMFMWKSNSLEYIEVHSNNMDLTSKDGVLFTKDMKKLFLYPIGNKKLTYSIPEGVTTLSSHCFYKSIHLKSITISSSVKSLSYGANFWLCKSLKTIFILGDNPPSYKDTKTGSDGEHEGCGTLLKPVSSSPFYCQTRSDITVYVSQSYSIPSENTFLGKSVTYSRLTFTETVNTTTWSIYDNGMTRINGTNDLSQQPKVIKQNSSSIKEILIESGITSITKNSFNNLTNLQKITLPDSISSIDKSSFETCSSLKEVEIDPTNETYYSDENGNVYKKDTNEIIFTTSK